MSEDVQAVTTEVTKAISDWSGELKAFKHATRETNEKVMTAVTAQGSEVNEAVKTATNAIEKVEAFAANLTEIEQKLASSATAGDPIPAKSLGQIVTSSREYKAVIEGMTPGSTPSSGFSLHIEANTLFGQRQSGTNTGDSDDTLIPVDRRPGIVPGVFRALRIRDLIPTIPTMSNAWAFTRELVFTNTAATVAEGAMKPQATLTFQNQTVFIRTIANFIKVSNQVIDDAPALATYIDTRLSHAVDEHEEYQIVSGDGQGQNMSGMTMMDNFTEFNPTSGESGIDSINRAKYAVIAADYNPTGILMNPVDWGNIERQKGDQGNYLVGNPFGTIIPVMWGLPVVLSNNFPEGKIIVADFTTSYEYIQRQTTAVDFGLDSNDFTHNLMTIRAEKRGALATIRPASIMYGDLMA